MSVVKVYTSAARTATPTKVIFSNHQNATGIVVVIDATTAGSPSVVFKIQGYDRVSGKFWDILTSAAVTATGTTVLKVYPGLTPVENTVASDVLPDEWAVDATHTGTVSITYSVTAHPIQ
jgi:hypothetical protein